VYSLLLERLELTDRVKKLVGDLVTGLVHDYRLGDAVPREACEFGVGIEV
jgi:hypothetical protein